MRIRVSKHQLLRQLPDKVRTDLVSCNDLPDYFVFDVFSAEYPETTKDKKQRQKMQEEVDYVGLKESYPDVAAALTGMEWYMFCVMLKHPSGASVHQLGGKLRHPEANLGNNVSVHIKGMRKRLEAKRLPWSVETRRANVVAAGSYKLIRKA